MFQERPATIAPVMTSRRRALAPVPESRAEAPARVGELWLAAHFPRLPLDAVLPGTAQARAAVVTALDDPRRTVVACNERAARQGITPGMGLNAALARVPGLRALERRPAAEAVLLDRLGRWALQFTPVVSLEPPGAVLAEVRGSLNLFGGVMALLRRALAGIEASGLSASLALEHPPFIDDNLMADIGDARHLTLGQCFRSHFAVGSILSASTGSAPRRCDDSKDGATSRCPPLELDVP
jgi:protein ImuB